MSGINKSNLVDKIGIAVTSLCALHCILLPVMLPMLPLLGLSFLAEHGFEHVILVLTLAAGAIALFSGFHRYHKKLYPIYALALGIVLYVSRDFLGEELQTIVLLIGAGLIIFAHVMNIRLCKSCKSCESH
ncbi:MerC domain-containing protein [Algibacillus agarilyticus]|uniref:MerC domain-containing protein n=1 Tax=Algibacillus agarilyticus TaxID=2234133 RepID=UPI000DCFA602|nr:MerC domain-containing protein [Algibacillus agarilyticus]